MEFINRHRPVEKSWTLEEASQYQSEFDASKENSGGTGRGPLFQWIGLHTLDQLESRYKAGDKLAILDAVSECALNDLVMPEWVATAFLETLRAVRQHKVKTLDEAFGPYHKKSENLSALRKRRKLAPIVYVKVEEARRVGKTIDNALYEDIGRGLGIGKTLAQEYYRHCCNRIDKKKSRDLT